MVFSAFASFNGLQRVYVVQLHQQAFHKQANRNAFKQKCFSFFKDIVLVYSDPASFGATRRPRFR